MRLKFVYFFCYFVTANAAVTSDPVSKCGPALAEVSYGGLSYTVTQLGNTGYTLKPTKRSIPKDHMAAPVVQSINKIWNQAEFEVARKPVSIGQVKDQSNFVKSGVPRVLDMPIKFPGEDTVRVPSELQQFQESIQQVLDYEFSVNPEFRDYYAYITVDQKHVEAGSTQRNAGPHVDGLQGKAYTQKIDIDHSYLVSSTNPTVFYTHAFDLKSFDINRHNFNRVFAAQADKSQTSQPAPFEIVLMDAFTVHESPQQAVAGNRTILRIEFSKKVYNRLGNTHNPLFDYSWEMIPRPIPENLE